MSVVNCECDLILFLLLTKICPLCPQSKATTQEGVQGPTTDGKDQNVRCQSQPDGSQDGIEDRQKVRSGQGKGEGKGATSESIISSN